MATFVLVHGAWHGGWCWKKVTPLLRAAGHDVFTPTLTGLGERAHLLSPDIHLTTHIQDIVNVLVYEDLYEVVLVGHSYGGVIISGVTDHLPERIAHLVYLDALVMDSGQSVMDLMVSPWREMFLKSVTETGDGWKIASETPAELGVTNPADVAWLDNRLGPHPLKTDQEPLVLKNDAVARLPRTFIYCSDRTGPSTLTEMAKKVQAQDGWRYREIHTGHDAMVTAPQELAALLLECVS